MGTGQEVEAEVRIAGYYIEIGFSGYDLLAMALLTGLWFTGIFGFRIGLAFLELMPQLGALTADYRPSPRLDLLTTAPLLTSFLLALILGPLTHTALTRASLIQVFREFNLEEEEAEPEEMGQAS